MSGATDSGMVKTMGIVIAALAVLAILSGLAASMLSGTVDDADNQLMRNALIQRIQPVASVRTSLDELPASSAQAATVVATAAKTPEELVNGACAACHVAGVAGAPLLGDDAAWAPRREAGLDALVASVINGKGSMPARGGSTYSDEEIRTAVISIAMFPTDNSSAAASDSNEATVAEETAPATSEQTSASETVETVVDESAANSAEVETAAPAAALVVGQVPEGLTDSIKATVDGICAGCHLAGIANAPKNGDKAAWQARADKGLDALVASVINGLNVMPPRGGSTLTDDEIPIAIQYLMSK
jgi:cytochrome c5